MSRTATLQVTTPSDTEIAMTREFDAPRQLVYDAFTKPELVRRWLGAVSGYTMAVCEIDLRVGGAYRYVWRGPDGGSMGMGGTYREIVPAERIVSTERFDEAWYDGDAVGTVVFVERIARDGALASTSTTVTTTVTTTVRYASAAVRDAVLRTPMERGVAAGYDRLDEILDGIPDGILTEIRESLRAGGETAI